MLAWALALTAATPSWAGAGGAVRLLNDLSAGTQAVYSLTVRTTRTAPRSGGQPREVLTYLQAGRLTLVILSPPRHSTVQRAWMIELDEGRIETLTRSGREVAVNELPEGVELGLPPRASQLVLDQVSPKHAPAHAAGGSPIQQTAFLLAMDVTHWPAGPVKPSAGWRHELQYEFLEATRSWTLEEVRGRGRAREAVVTSTATGRFGGALGGLATIVDARSRLVWLVSEHSLNSMTAEVELRYSSDGRPRGLKTDLSLERVDRRELSPAEREAAAEELAELTAAIETYSRGGRAEVVEALRQFEASHRRSLWLPVARDLHNKARYERRKLETLSGERLTSVLIQLLARWQKVAVEGGQEPLEPLRRAFADLAGAKGDELVELAGDPEASLRALAVFCLAFGPAGQHEQVLVTACDDPQATVRAWAVYGLAQRGDPRTDPELLQRVLGDADDKVRQRACQAVEACIAADGPQGKRFADLLLDMVGSDPVEEVRIFAAGGLMRLADKKHLPALRRVAARERAAKVRERLQRVIERLEADAASGA